MAHPGKERDEQERCQARLTPCGVARWPCRRRGGADRPCPRRRRGVEPGQPAAERRRLDQDARRRRRIAALRQARQVRGAHRPPRRGLAHRLAAKLGELHAAARARRHHHAERPVLRAPPFRHRRGQSRRLPADDPRPRRQAADLHARRHQAHAARQPRLFLRMRGELRHGMARRAAQRRAIHPRHGALRDVHRRAAQGAAQRSRAEAEGEVALDGRRRLRGDDALAAARTRRSTTRSSPTA